MEHDTMINGPTEIVQETFNGTPMITCRLMHELREFVYCVSNVSSCQWEVLEVTNNSPILRWIDHVVLESSVRVGLVARGVAIVFASIMQARVSKLMMYCRWQMKRPWVCGVTSTPRKYDRDPRSLSENHWDRRWINLCIASTSSYVLLRTRASYSSDIAWHI